MSKKPAYRVFISDAEGVFNYKEEFCALWENTSRAGKPYWSCKLKDGRRVQMFEVKEREQASVPDPQEQVPDDVPF
ncbi:MAG: hypothetical protein ABFC80_02755 [Coriobacteriales bacterium]